MTAPLLYAEGKPVSDNQAFEDAILLSLERTMRQARFLQQRYLLLVEPMSKVLYENFPEPPEWSAGFCFTADGTLPYDGERYVICMLNSGHRGECGGRDLLRKVDRQAARTVMVGAADHIARLRTR